jgi:adenine-specific DNA methylase
MEELIKMYRDAGVNSDDIDLDKIVFVDLFAGTGSMSSTVLKFSKNSKGI